MQKPQTIYERIGGRPKIYSIVCDFYQTILADDSLNIFYIQNVSEISDLHDLMTDFQTLIFGGPNNYKGRDMVTAHKHMPLNNQHFDKVWQHMVMSYKKHKISDDLISQIKEIVYSMKQDIVHKK